MKPVHPIRREPSLRYMRSRGNRRVRKVRILRNLGRLCGALAVNLLIMGVILIVIYQSAQVALDSKLFALKQIEIEGTQRVPAERVRAELDEFLGRSLFRLNLDRIAARATHTPWVIEASATRVLPDTLRLEVIERRPTALAIIANVAHLVDETGFVIGPTGPGIDDDLPVLTGLAGLERDELISTLQRGVEMLGRLHQISPEFVAEISELQLRRDSVIVRTRPPGPRLLLDPAQVERNLHRYLGLRESIENRLGIAEYVDLRWRNRIAVQPAATLDG